MQARANGPVRTVFIGWGAIGSRVGDLLARRSAPVEIVGIATIDTPAARAALPPHISFLADPARLAELKPDLVVEAAGRRAIDQWAPAALQHAGAMIIASTSAFVDDALLPRLQAIAERHGSRILIPSGAIGAIDAIASASVLGLDEALHQIVKPPAAWKGTPAEKLFDAATLTEAKVFYEGSARQAAATIRRTPTPRSSPRSPASGSIARACSSSSIRPRASTSTASWCAAPSASSRSCCATIRSPPTRSPPS